jgi:hypothetical protein
LQPAVIGLQRQQVGVAGDQEIAVAGDEHCQEPVGYGCHRPLTGWKSVG